jgi:hypothetical protein
VSHQSSVPAFAAHYFSEHGIEFDHGSVFIAQAFKPDVGWRNYPGRKRVSLSELRRLRGIGATNVSLAIGTRRFDFTIKELLSGGGL